LQEIRISIDPFKDAEEQTKIVVDQLRPVLPLKSERLRLLIRIPPQFAPQATGVLKNYGEIQKEEWGADGTLTALLEVPAGVHTPLVERLGSVTKGSAEVSIIR
jgi:ribosome maturation protein SDO1